MRQTFIILEESAHRFSAEEKQSRKAETTRDVTPSPAPLILPICDRARRNPAKQGAPGTAPRVLLPSACPAMRARLCAAAGQSSLVVPFGRLLLLRLLSLLLLLPLATFFEPC